MSLNSRQKTVNITNTIGVTGGFSNLFTGDPTIEIDNIFYDTRCNLSNGFRPGKTEQVTFNDEDDEGNAIVLTFEAPVVNESGSQVKHDYIQCDDGHDEVYFYHVWDWAYDLNSSRQQVITRTIRGIKENIESTAGNQNGSQPIITSSSYDLVERQVSWTNTLDKVETYVEGIPSGKDIQVYAGATDDDKIFFKYSANTITVVKPGDVINGATVTKVLNYSETVENNINKDTLCYAEISDGNNFTADQTYTASLSGASIVVIAGRGIRTRSAAVGIYVERDHKAIDISPIFYKNETDSGCQRELDSDSDADYVKGTLSLTNGDTPFKNQWFVITPKTETAKFISAITYSFFRVYPEKQQLKKWIGQSNLGKLELQNIILSDMNQIFGAYKVLEFIDTCFNPILSFISQSYSPQIEILKVQSATENLSRFIDECLPAGLKSASDANVAEQTKKVYKDFTEFGKDLQKRVESGDSSIVFPDEFYKKVVSNQDSMMNKINETLKSLTDTFNDQVIYSLPSDVSVSDGENESEITITKTAFRDIPPRFPKIDILPSDVRVNDSKFDIVDFNNIITIQIYSHPKFLASSITTSDDAFLLTVDTDSNGYLMSVTAEAGTVEVVTTYVNTGLDTTVEVPSITHGPGGTGVNQGLQPHIIWSAVSSTQSIYDKDFRFRSQEFSDNTSKVSTTRGYPFKTNPVGSRLTQDLSASDTAINVKSTSGFMSSGYLVIPKYIKKIEIYGIDNIKNHYFYDGEEIIYYSEKTSTSFTGCIRGRFGTNSNFTTSLEPYPRSPGSKAVSTGYMEGGNISQYYPYYLE